ALRGRLVGGGLAAARPAQRAPCRAGDQRWKHHAGDTATRAGAERLKCAPEPTARSRGEVGSQLFAIFFSRIGRAFFSARQGPHMAAEIIDLALMNRSRRCLDKLLKTRGIAYFLKQDARRPFRLDSSRVELVVRAAVRLRPAHHSASTPKAVEHCRKEIRR